MKTTLLTKIILIFFCLVLISIIGLNFYSLKSKPDLFTQAKTQLFSLNQGDSYSGRLNLWRLLVQSNNWAASASLEAKLNSSEISDYKFNHQPSELQKKVDSLNSKTDKSVEDYLELARLQLLLGQKSQSLEAIQKARQLDPVRDDVDRLYYSLLK